ncbi:MAG: hypothetical protein MUO31_06755 [Thermodesulfovibrionales bacterium]|nr:hypothetical protein [Thermodesulfovibrionales bacterium]
MGVSTRLGWIAENLKIQNKAGRLVHLVANDGQILLNDTMEEQRRRSLPVRIVLLKPRQVGWTTWSEAEGFYDAYFRPNWQVFIGSLDTDSTDHVFSMTKLFLSEIADPKPTDATNRKEIIFSAPHRSKIIAQTAGKEGFGRGYTPHYFHASEVAFWPNAKKQLAGIYQGIPQGRDTTIILESTANGVGGAFYDTFWEAVERRKRNPNDYSGYLPVFFPWYRFSEYSIDPPKGFQMTSDEREESDQYDLRPGQIYWRRLKIDEVNGDISIFRQEYPATALEAFQASGNPVFTQQMIKSQESQVCPHPRYCIMAGEIENVDRIFNCWQIVRLPQINHDYCMGIDTMEGRVSDINDVKSNLDCDAIAIIDRAACEVVAIYHGRGNQADLGEQALRMAEFYNDAWVAPEIPAGMVVLGKFKDAGYDNIYNRQQHDERLETSDSENLGWRTTMITRDYMINQFITCMRDNSLTVNFMPVVEEMKTFIRDKTGKKVHMPSKHDDLLFAVMIALQVHLRCPVTQPYPDSHTTSYVPDYREDNIVYAGAVDCEYENEEDEEQIRTI